MDEFDDRKGEVNPLLVFAKVCKMASKYEKKLKKKAEKLKVSMPMESNDSTERIDEGKSIKVKEFDKYEHTSVYNEETSTSNPNPKRLKIRF